MSFRFVRTVYRFRSYSSASVPEFILLCGNAAPKTTILGSSSSSFSFFSSDTSEAAENYKTNANFSFFNIFQDWKNKFLAWRDDVPSVDAGENTTNPSPAIDLAPNPVVKPTPDPAIDLSPNSVVKTTPSASVLAENSVVKVFTVSSKPRLIQPWQNSLQSESTGSGFVISGKKVLTNAHVVADHISVKVRKHGSFTKYNARVRAIGHECDLAILEIDSEEFWEGMNPLEFGDIPSLQEKVVVVGYPKGGDTISVTEGIVSRVELLLYSHSETKLLAIQIDAAINSGNSGCPVIMGNKVAGVAFQGLCNSDNIGYIIPTPVVKQFLNGVEESGQHVHICSMNLSYQNMENSQLRDLYKMKSGMTGILVNQINPLSDAHKYLKKEDVILAIDGVPIGNDSTVPFRNKERINLKHLIATKKPCDTALFKILREGQEYEFNISLKPVQPLVPGNQFEKHPSYYIYGGLVFVPLTQENSSYFDASTWALEKMPTKVGEQIVVVSEILDDDVNTGYNEFEEKQVTKVNGVQVDNLKHLCELIEECRTGMVKLEFEKDKILGLNHKFAKKATSRIMKSLKIPSAMSDDLQPTKKVPRQNKRKSIEPASTTV